MKDVKTDNTHNFALVGHSGDGKTSLGEAILHGAGATSTLGSVTEGSSVLNHLPEEQERHTTITSSLYAFDHGGKHFTLVDTPGDSNFQADGQIALSALDGAVLLVSAVDGAKVGTDRMFRFCRERSLPIVAFVNGLDRERADFDAAVESLSQARTPARPCCRCRSGRTRPLEGVVDLVEMKASPRGGESSDIPVDLADDAAGRPRGAGGGRGRVRRRPAREVPRGGRALRGGGPRRAWWPAPAPARSCPCSAGSATGRAGRRTTAAVGAGRAAALGRRPQLRGRRGQRGGSSPIRRRPSPPWCSRRSSTATRARSRSSASCPAP